MKAEHKVVEHGAGYIILFLLDKPLGKWWMPVTGEDGEPLVFSSTYEALSYLYWN